MLDFNNLHKFSPTGDFAQYSKTHNEDDVFLLYQDYRQDQALMKILENPKHNQLGTYYKDGNMYIFAGLKKDANLHTAEHILKTIDMFACWQSR